MEFIDKIFPRKQDDVRFPKGFVQFLIKRLIEKISVGSCRFLKNGDGFKTIVRIKGLKKGPDKKGLFPTPSILLVNKQKLYQQ